MELIVCFEYYSWLLLLAIYENIKVENSNDKVLNIYYKLKIN